MIPRQKENLSWKRIGDEILILDSRYQKKSHSLNSMASEIWELIDGKRSLSDMTKLLTERFDVTPKQADSDIHLFINGLKEKGLIDIL